MRRLTLRARLVTTTTVAALVTVAVLVAGVQILLTHLTLTESLDALRDRAVAAATTVRGKLGHVRVLDVPSDSLDQNLWIYALGGARLDGSAPSRPLSPAVAELRHATHEETTTVAGRFRLLAEPVRTLGRGPVVAVVVAGVDLTPYESSERRRLWLSLALSAFAVFAAGSASWVGASYSLRQVREMARRADGWREHDLTGRFAVGAPRDELGELAQTLDRMLDRIATALRAERRLTDEVAHELRAPLTVIRAESELALLDPTLTGVTREALSSVVEGADKLNASISTILAVARSAHTEDRDCAVPDVLEEARRRACPREGVKVKVLPMADSLPVAAPSAVVTATLAPLVDNAVRHARTTVELDARSERERLLIIVKNDGPGVPEEEKEVIFAPGLTSTAEGAGLGLALSRRLAHSIGGTVRAEPADHGRFVVDLPSV